MTSRIDPSARASSTTECPRRRASIRRMWGLDMAALAGEVADAAGDATRLAHLQQEALIPLEVAVMADGPGALSRPEVADLVRSSLARWCAARS